MTTPSLLRLAYDAASDSPDPSTQTGAVLVSSFGRVLAVACNDLARGVKGDPARLTHPHKPHFIEHAERAVIFKAARQGLKTHGTTLVAPWAACADCARAIIAAGIVRVVVHGPVMERTPDRWRASIDAANTMLREAGVVVETYLDPISGEPVRFDGGLLWP